MKKLLRNQHGYTLAEAIVAIGILASALLGTLVLAAQSINVTDIAQTKTQAEFLAEEGIELSRAFRESAAGTFKMYDTSTPCQSSCPQADFSANIKALIPNNGDHVDANIDSMGRVCVNNSGCYPLYIDTSVSNRYMLRTTGSASTRFKRTVTFTRKQETDGARHSYIEVVSKVDFTIRGSAQSSTYSLTTHFYDWI